MVINHLLTGMILQVSIPIPSMIYLPTFHQNFKVPKMEGFLNLISGSFGGWGFPYVSRIHTAYIGGYLF